MTRRQNVTLFIVQVIPIWLSLYCCLLIFGAGAGIPEILLFVTAGVFISLWARTTLKAWFRMADLALHLADEAVTELDDCESGEVQIAQVVGRLMPPRQMYACVIAHRGEPVKLLRGWKMISGKPLTKPGDTRTEGFSCRVVRY